MPLRFFTQIMDSLSALNAVSNEVRINELQGVNELTYYILFGPGTSAGAFQVETAHVNGFSGTWHPESTPVAWVAANRVHVFRLTGMSFVSRVRISTAVVGGTMSIWAMGN